MGTEVKEPSKTTVRAAWQLYPDAQSEEAACLADKVLSKVKPQWETLGLSKLFGERSIQIISGAWSELSQSEKDMLPNSARISLAQKLPHETKADNLRAEILGDSNFSTDSFKSWDYAHLGRVMERLGQDPIVIEAQKRWNDPSFSIKDKLAFAQHVQNIQAETYSAVAVPIKEINRQNTKILLNGSYSGSIENRDAKIEINIAPLSSIHGPFAEFMDTIIHEGAHAIQSQLISRYQRIKLIEDDTLADLGVKSTSELSADGLKTFEAERDRLIAKKFPNDPGGWNKELIAGGKLRAVLLMFEYNFHDDYMSMQASGSNYYYNPIENHAREVGLMLNAYFSAEPSQRKPHPLQDLAILLGETHNHINEERAQKIGSPAACP